MLEAAGRGLIAGRNSGNFYQTAVGPKLLVIFLLKLRLTLALALIVETLVETDDEDSLEDIATKGAGKASSELIVKTLSPAAEEIGRSLIVIAKTVNICLSPLSAVVWGYEEIRAYIEKSVTEKLAHVAPEKVVTPSPSIAGPVIEGMRFSGETAEIREMFASLLSAAMNIDTKNQVHPAYVEIVKQISVDEAVILKSLVESDEYPLVAKVTYEIEVPHYIGERISEEFREKCEKLKLNNPDQLESYLDNLLRLKIIEFIPLTESRLEAPNYHYEESEYQLKQGGDDRLYLTSFGQQFLRTCF